MGSYPIVPIGSIKNHKRRYGEIGKHNALKQFEPHLGNFMGEVHQIRGNLNPFWIWQSRAKQEKS
jgi:hypothetical protein